MKDFLENLKTVITEKAEVVSKKTGEVVDVVAKKTEETVEVTKLKNQIHMMERSNDRDFKDIGKMIYDKFKQGEEVEEEYVELCEMIADRDMCIQENKKDIARIKGLGICKNCEAPLEEGMKFCPKCGAEI